jgi:hypothetical protein
VFLRHRVIFPIDGDYRCYDEDGHEDERVGRKDDSDDSDENEESDNQHQPVDTRPDVHDQIPPQFKASTIKHMSAIHRDSASLPCTLFSPTFLYSL